MVLRDASASENTSHLKAQLIRPNWPLDRHLNKQASMTIF